MYGGQGLDAILMPNICSGNLTVVKVKLTNKSGTETWVAVASAYLPHDDAEPPPPQEVQTLVEYYTRHKIPLILGCDANAHQPVWGSSDTNSRGEALLRYPVATNLNTLNRGTDLPRILQN